MRDLIDGQLVLVGAGKMGGAMLTGWLAGGLPAEQVLVQDPGPPDEIASVLRQHGIEALASVGERLAKPPSVILMAVKPQIMDQVFPPLAKLAGRETLVLSVAAGRTMAGFETHLPTGTAVVRSIPNTPAAIGRGITVCVANAHVTDRQKTLCDQLLAAIGDVGWVDDEGLIDAATAVSGSGPAYVFLLAECLAQAGVEVGLSPELAARLANATVAGAGELIRQSEDPPSTLRENVTSPNGTTYAALQVLMGQDGMKDLLSRAVAA
ncbi:MAG: pyrroline-5-carboxylate reductase, partial [Hyphomicrobiaceae bacterium]